MTRRMLALGLVVSALASCGQGQPVADRTVERVLVVSLPGVAWDDVRRGDLPNLERFVEEAAVGDLSSRIGRRGAKVAEAYLTMGAGTRAVAPSAGAGAGVALEPDETYHAIPARELLARRLGFVPDGIAHLGVGAARDANDRSPYGGEVGLLGDRLDDAGVRRLVIGNADVVEGSAGDETYGRDVASMLMGSDGLVPEGAVSRRLLAADERSPFGARLDPGAAIDAFRASWSAPGPIVAVVEASDLIRVAAYSSQASASQRRALRDEALRRADDLLGDLLAEVDPERDAVVVLSPVAPSGAPALGVVAVAAPGLDAGLLHSATTRRAGYVQLADVAPTVLTLLGEDEPDAIEGRAFWVDEESGDRVARLADAADAAEARDELMPMATTLFVAMPVLLALAAVGVARRWLRSRVRAVLVTAAMVVLGAVPATFLAGAADISAADRMSYWSFVAVVSVVLGAVYVAVDRRWPGAGSVAAVTGVVALISVDVALGALLQLNTVFGYSVAVAGRFVGVGNLAFALLGAATVVLAALLAETGASGRRLAVAVLAAVVVIDGAPMLGADVGGMVSMVPAFGVTALLLSGRRIGARQVVGIGVATVAVVLTAAFVDLARAADARTHLARLAEHVVHGRGDALLDTFGRRWQASFGGAEVGAWVVLAILTVVVGGYLVVVAARRAGMVSPLVSGEPASAAAAGLGVLALVGLVANDSSFAVPATMLIVVVPVLVIREVSRS